MPWSFVSSAQPAYPAGAASARPDALQRLRSYRTKSISFLLIAFLGLAPFFSVYAGSPKPTRSSAPSLSPDAAQNSGLTESERDQAQKLYLTKCMRCHKSYEPASYSQQDWDMWMRKMSRKARLSPEQATMLVKYLAAYRAQTAVGTNPVVHPSSAELR